MDSRVCISALKLYDVTSFVIYLIYSWKILEQDLKLVTTLFFHIHH